MEYSGLGGENLFSLEKAHANFDFDVLARWRLVWSGDKFIIFINKIISLSYYIYGIRCKNIYFLINIYISGYFFKL